ncbi:MAG TPA: acetylornithine deacetylase [Methylocystis sp.]|nr:acetylornithine deacetylase [Methylocystis sp.]
MRLEAAIDLTERLVAFDTESSKSNLALIAAVEDYLREHGATFWRIPNAAGDKASLFATFGPNVEGGVLLSGHTDVVPVAGQSWTADPFTLRRVGSRLVGRGAVDMKGFDAVCLAMVPEFMAAPLKRPIHLLLSYDEETTCSGPIDAIRRFGLDLPLPGAVIVGEPTSMQVADAHKSVTTHTTRVLGHEIHSAKLHQGLSAVHMACRLVTELERIGEDFRAAGDPSGRFDPPYSTVHVGSIAGGTARNIVARACEFHWEFRALPDSQATAAKEALELFAAKLRETAFAPFPRASIETTTDTQVLGLFPQPGSRAETLALRLAKANRTIAVPYATEAGQFQAAGVPTVVCGPGRIDEAHQPDEFIEIAELSACVDFMRGLARELSA